MNHQIDMGAKQPLSGFLCQEVSKVRNRYMNTLKLEKKNTMHSWNRETIKSLLDFSNALWKFRSDILHDEAVFTQETMLRDQAIQLLSTLQFTPYQLPQKSHKLLNRTKSYLQTSHLRNIISWTNRVNKAMEEQNYSERSTSNDIRT